MLDGKVNQRRTNDGKTDGMVATSMGCEHLTSCLGGGNNFVGVSLAWFDSPLLGSRTGPLVRPLFGSQLGLALNVAHGRSPLSRRNVFRNARARLLVSLIVISGYRNLSIDKRNGKELATCVQIPVAN